MTRQLAAPIQHLSLTPTNRTAIDLYHQYQRGRIVLDPPYQRGSVWSDDQRLDLMYSYLAGYPTGTLIFNDRMRGSWTRGDDFTVSYAVIDGRQRLETIIAWFNGHLAIPASWVREHDLLHDEAWIDLGDGPYVYCNYLTENGARRIESRMGVPVVTAQVDTLEAEAEIFRLVNAGGTAQTQDDLERAAQVERGEAVTEAGRDERQ
jgi:hypothetical protein